MHFTSTDYSAIDNDH